MKNITAFFLPTSFLSLPTDATQNPEHDDQEIIIPYKEGQIFYETGDYEKALIKFKECYKLLLSGDLLAEHIEDEQGVLLDHNNTQKFSDILSKISWCYLKLKQYDLALLSSNKIGPSYIKDQDFNCRAICILKLNVPSVASAEILSLDNKASYFPSSIEALDNFECITEKINKTDFYNSKGLCQFYSYQFSSAVKNFEKAIAIDAMCGVALYNKAVAFYIIYKLELNTAATDDFNILGEKSPYDLSAQELIDEAVKCLNAALNICYQATDLGAAYKATQCLTLIGEFFKLSNQYTEALQYFTYAEESLVKDNIIEQIKNKVAIANVHLSRKHYIAAQKYYEDASWLFNYLKNNDDDKKYSLLKCEVFLALANVLNSNKNAKAFKYFEKIISLKYIYQDQIEQFVSSAYLGIATLLKNINLHRLSKIYCNQASNYFSCYNKKYQHQLQDIKKIYEKSEKDVNDRQSIMALIKYYEKISKQLSEDYSRAKTINQQPSQCIEIIDLFNAKKLLDIYLNCLNYYVARKYDEAIKIINDEHNYLATENILINDFCKIGMSILSGLICYKFDKKDQAASCFNIIVENFKINVVESIDLFGAEAEFFEDISKYKKIKVLQKIYNPNDIAELLEQALAVQKYLCVKMVRHDAYFALNASSIIELYLDGIKNIIINIKAAHLWQSNCLQDLEIIKQLDCEIKNLYEENKEKSAHLIKFVVFVALPENRKYLEVTKNYLDKFIQLDEENYQVLTDNLLEATGSVAMQDLSLIG